jgi:hypothetical protein
MRTQPHVLNTFALGFLFGRQLRLGAGCGVSWRRMSKEGERESKAYRKYLHGLTPQKMQRTTPKARIY